ncbi:MAG: inosine/xanthosine triphosphatase [Thermoproteota archaeon]
MDVCKVAVGSSNAVKVNAVKKAFSLICRPDVKGVEVEIGVPRQPLGFSEILAGATNRALKALEVLNADYGVGVEAGAVMEWTGYPLELQVAVVINRQGNASVGVSPAFPLPPRWRSELLAGLELGEIASRELKRQNIGRRLGLIGYLTGGLVTRTDLTYFAVVMALTPWIHPDLYGELVTVDALARTAQDVEREG